MFDIKKEMQNCTRSVRSMKKEKGAREDGKIMNHATSVTSAIT